MHTSTVNCLIVAVGAVVAVGLALVAITQTTPTGEHEAPLIEHMSPDGECRPQTYIVNKHHRAACDHPLHSLRLELRTSAVTTERVTIKTKKEFGDRVLEEETEPKVTEAKDLVAVCLCPDQYADVFQGCDSLRHEVQVAQEGLELERHRSKALKKELYECWVK